jgi:hypothetical protein
MAAPGLIAGERTFKQTASLRSGLALLMFVPLAIAWSIADDPSPLANPELLWITLSLAALFAALWILIGKTVLTITEQGVRRESIFGVQEIFWTQVKETRFIDKPVRVGAHFGLIGMIVAMATKSSARSNITLTLVSSDGIQLKVTSNFQQAKDAANLILARVLPTMLGAARSRIQRGETVRFGTVGLTATDVAWKSEPGVPLTELTSAELLAGSLKIKRSGGWRAFISVRSDKVPDVFVLLELLDEMAPQLRQRLDPLARVRS